MTMVQGSVTWENDARDEKIFRDIFQLYNKALVYYASQIVEWHDAEEITSDSFMKCWQLRHQFSHIKQVRAFLYITTYRACIDHIRKKRSSLTIISQIPPDAFPDMNQEEIERVEIETAALQKLYEALHRLKGRKKEVGLLAFHEGFSNEEIGRLLQLRNQVVRNRKAQVVRWLRHCINLKNIF